MKEIAKLLVSHNIVQTEFKNPFKWTSGILSPIYCDCRELIGIPKARKMINNYFLAIIKEKNLPHDIISGTATAGIPWAAFVADALEKPMLYVRSKPKGHGAGKMVEGRGEKGKNILVVEDAISTGGSSIQSAKALREELDGTVENILAIFSWSTPAAKKNAEEAGVNIFTLTEFSEIAEALLEAGKISEAEKADLERFNKNPVNWKLKK